VVSMHAIEYCGMRVEKMLVRMCVVLTQSIILSHLPKTDLGTWIEGASIGNTQSGMTHERQSIPRGPGVHCES
jgi:hypothetical protein